MRLTQRSIAELRAEAYAEMQSFERYFPSEEDKAKGRWTVIVMDKQDHLIPNFGIAHYVTELCWCEPGISDGTVSHKASQ